MLPTLIELNQKLEQKIGLYLDSAILDIQSHSLKGTTEGIRTSMYFTNEIEILFGENNHHRLLIRYESTPNCDEYLRLSIEKNVNKEWQLVESTSMESSILLDKYNELKTVLLKFNERVEKERFNKIL